MESLYDLAEHGAEAWTNERPTTIAVDTETEGVEFYDRPFCVTIAWYRDDGDYTGYYFELPDYAHVVKEILLSTPEWVFHNAKFDLQKLVLAGILDRSDIQPERFEDTEAIAHLLDEHQSKGLKSLAVNVLGIDDTVEVEIKSGPNKGQMRKVPREKVALDAARKEAGLTAADGYHLLPRSVVIPYAIMDAVLTMQLYGRLRPELARFTDLSDLYEHELRLTLALLDIEAAGMALDMDYLEATTKEYARLCVMSELKIRDMTNEDFLPTSWQQVLAELHRRGHNIENTQSETLEALDDEFAREILNLRTLRKIHGTYLQNMLDSQRGGIIHPNFRQHGTKTGRMSSGEAEE
jgi:DNA polymerase I-like protein with 3'-5' exonuclease and polymerase domains